MGAGRGRLIRQLLTESFLLALAGAGVGFLLAAGAARAVSSFRLPAPVPVVFDFNVDLRVAVFTVALSLVTAVVFGLVPALRATRPDLVGALKEWSAAPGRAGRSGMRNTLVTVQVALSLVLLTAAGLFLRSLGNASSVDIGFKPDNILVMRVDPKVHNYSAERTMQFLSQLRDRVSALPGVRSVSFVDVVPLSIAGTGRNFEVDATKGRPAQSVNAVVYGVFSGYFQTMGIRLLSGRDFNLQANNQNVAIINETMAGRLFPKQDPIGRLVRADKDSYTVIGVARNSKSRTVGEGPVNCAYLFLDVAPGKGVIMFQVKVLVLNVQTGMHPLLHHPGAKRTRRGLGYPTVEDQLQAVGPAQVEVVPHHFFEEFPPLLGAIKDLGQTHLHLPNRQPPVITPFPILGAQGQPRGKRHMVSNTLWELHPITAFTIAPASAAPRRRRLTAARLGSHRASSPGFGGERQ